MLGTSSTQVTGWQLSPSHKLTDVEAGTERPGSGLRPLEKADKGASPSKPLTRAATLEPAPSYLYIVRDFDILGVKSSLMPALPWLSQLTEL